MIKTGLLPLGICPHTAGKGARHWVRTGFVYLIHHFLVLRNPHVVHRIQGYPANATEPLQVSFVDILRAGREIQCRYK